MCNLVPVLFSGFSFNDKNITVSKIDEVIIHRPFIVSKKFGLRKLMLLY